MTESFGSLAEVRAALALVAESLAIALRHAGAARARIDDAVAELDALGEHREPLVPPELRLASAELDRSLALISGGQLAVADLDARL